jgi:hypothetical protein
MKNRLIFLFSVVSLLTLSCSKEKILEKRLEGRWLVSVYQKNVYTETTPVLSKSLSFSSAGNINFNSNGSGTYHFVYDFQESCFDLDGTFDWDNTADEVIFRESTGTKTYDVTKNTSSEIVLERTVKPFYYSGMDPDSEYYMTERLKLKK